MSVLNALITSFGAIILLLFLVMKVRMHAFVALMIVSILAGVLSSMPLNEITASMQKGMSGTLGFLAIVVALGAMFGKVLQITGALEQIANFLTSKFGEKKSHFAFAFAGMICALPLFFDVAIVLLISMVFAIAKKIQIKNIVKFALSLFAGVAAAAAFLLPGPTPMLLASQMNADFGFMILFGLIVAIPAMLLAGPIFGSIIEKFVSIEIPQEQLTVSNKQLPDIKTSLLILILPLLLVGSIKILSADFLNLKALMPYFYNFLQLLGHPFVALLLALLVAIYYLSKKMDFTKEEIFAACNEAITPAGIILLVTGAGGVFKQILVDSSVGQVLGNALIDLGLPIALACFVIAGCVRVIQGSATVACLTTVGLVGPFIEQAGFSGAQLAALSICIAGGSIILSHVNDSGFWLFSKFTGATEIQTLKTWTIMETILGVVGACLGMLIFSFL